MAAAQQEVNFLEMSDDDILNMPEPTEEPINDEQEEQTSEEEEVSQTQEEDVTDEGQELPDEESVEGEDEADPDENADAENAESDEGSHDASAEGEGKADEQEKVTTPEEQLAALFSPFKANGKQMQVSSVEDAMTLMQMGANYNKKMAGLKPNLKLMKMLANNDLLDEKKLTYLIDLEKKNPDAIKKLIKESELDPLELDTDEKADYTPGTYTVGEEEVELDMVLESIQDTPSFQTTIDNISNKWDKESKKIALDSPQIIATINDHVASGIYDEVMGIVEKERMLGRLSDVSDLAAYKHVGEVLQANGAFDKNQQPEANGTTNTPQQLEQENPKRKDKRRAAGGTKTAPKTKRVSNDYNPLGMSDEDFDTVSAPI